MIKPTVDLQDGLIAPLKRPRDAKSGPGPDFRKVGYVTAFARP
jgi:hypothetical protein